MVRSGEKSDYEQCYSFGFLVQNTKIKLKHSKQGRPLYVMTITVFQKVIAKLKKASFKFKNKFHE